MLEGRLLQREVHMKTGGTLGWDDPLPEELRPKWEKLINTVQSMENIAITRPLVPAGIGPAIKKQLFCFTDASEDAVAYVVYHRVVTSMGGFRYRS